MIVILRPPLSLYATNMRVTIMEGIVDRSSAYSEKRDARLCTSWKHREIGNEV